MYPNRKQFQFVTQASDRQLWAIGMVVVQWSNFEQYVLMTARTLLEHAPERLSAFNNDRRMERRLDMLADAIGEEVAEPYRGRLQKLLIVARQLKQERDKFAHNAWGYDGEAGDAAPEEANSNFDWSGDRKATTWKLDFGRIKETAVNLDKLTAGWISVFFAGEDNALWTDLVRSKMLRPNG